MLCPSLSLWRQPWQDRVSQNNTISARPRPRPIFWSQIGLVRKPTVSDHITGDNNKLLYISVIQHVWGESLARRALARQHNYDTNKQFSSRPRAWQATPKTTPPLIVYHAKFGQMCFMYVVGVWWVQGRLKRWALICVLCDSSLTFCWVRPITVDFALYFL